MCSSDLEAELVNGQRILGESLIYDAITRSHSRIRRVRLLPERPTPLPRALEAIARADMIILGPGSLYTSVIPNLLVDGIPQALAAARAKKVMVMNIMTEQGETEEYTGLDHVQEMLRYAPGGVDCVLANCSPIPDTYLPAYKQENAAPLVLCRKEIEALGIPVYEKELLAPTGQYVRHDPEALAVALMQLLQEDWR